MARNKVVAGGKYTVTEQPKVKVPDEDFALGGIEPNGTVHVKRMTPDGATVLRAQKLTAVFVRETPDLQIGEVSADADKLVSSDNDYPKNVLDLSTVGTNPDVMLSIRVGGLAVGDYYVFVVATFPE